LGPARIIWDQISKIWPQNGQPGNPAYHLDKVLKAVLPLGYEEKP